MHSNRNSFKLRTVVLFSSEHARRVTVNWKLCKLEGWTRRNWEEGASIAYASARATDLRRRRTASRLVVFSKPQRWAMLRNTTKANDMKQYVLCTTRKKATTKVPDWDFKPQQDTNNNKKKERQKSRKSFYYMYIKYIPSTQILPSLDCLWFTLEYPSSVSKRRFSVGGEPSRKGNLKCVFKFSGLSIEEGA